MLCSLQVTLDSFRPFQPFGPVFGSLFRDAFFGFADLLTPPLPLTAIGPDVEFDGMPSVIGQVCQFTPDLSDVTLHSVHSEFRFLVGLPIRFFRFLLRFDQPAKLIFQ